MDQYLAVNTMPAMLPVQVMDKYSFTPGICANTMPFMLPVQVRDTDSLTRGICVNGNMPACRHWKGVLNAMRRIREVEKVLTAVISVACTNIESRRSFLAFQQAQQNKNLFTKTYKSFCLICH